MPAALRVLVGCSLISFCGAAGQNFVMKLDASGGKLLATMRGIGGRIATDDQGSIYVAGLDWPSTIPITPGAFQSTHQLNGCGGTGQLGLGCSYQYVTKVNASLSQILYSTSGGLAATVVSAIALPGSISGVWQVDVRLPENQFGAIPISLSVDSVPVRDQNLTIWTGP